MERRRRPTGRAPLKPATRARRLLALALPLLGIASAAAPGTIRLGGVLPLDAGRAARWCWSGTFRYPVGDPRQLGAPGPEGAPGFLVNRGIGEAGGHQGADLDNRRGGDPVRAAAHGLVVSAADDGWNGGYGSRVVLAHRLMDESLAFSVYAHLAPGPPRVRVGDAVHAGQPLGRVGRSGRATTEHLHFEIRLPDGPETPWERARIVDPIAFVEAHLTPPADSSGSDRYLAWAEDAGLILANASADEAMDHARWWTMLARAARHDLPRLPDDPAGLRPLLVTIGLLPSGPAGDSGQPVGWDEFQRDLERLRRTGVRLPPVTHGRRLHRETGARDRAAEAPVGAPAAGARAAPTLAEACAALAEIAGNGDAIDASGNDP